MQCQENAKKEAYEFSSYSTVLDKNDSKHKQMPCSRPYLGFFFKIAQRCEILLLCLLNEINLSHFVYISSDTKLMFLNISSFSSVLFIALSIYSQFGILQSYVKKQIYNNSSILEQILHIVPNMKYYIFIGLFSKIFPISI